MKPSIKYVTFLIASSMTLTANAGLFDKINNVLDTVDKVNNTIDRGENTAKRTSERFPSQQSQPQTQPSQQPYQPSNGQSMEYNINRKGSDYRNFELSQANPQLCQSACQIENRCQAWTYVNPGIQSNNAMCWLKDKVPQGFSNSCCTSGIKTINSEYQTSSYGAYGASKNVSGLWSSSWYDMSLKQKQGESAVSGTYGFNGGRIYGTMNGDTLTGYWIATGATRECSTTKYGSRHWGRIKFTFINNEFKGMYQYCENEPTSEWEWHGKRK